MLLKISIALILIAQLIQFVISVEIARLTTTERQAEELESEEDENVTNIDESMKNLHQSTTDGESELIMMSDKSSESGIKKS